MSHEVIVPHFEPSARPALGPRVVSGKYALLRELGSGSTGTVYEAENLIVGKRVAIKVLHTRYAEHGVLRSRFVQEAHSAALIAHENVADIYDLGTDRDGTPYLVMELLEGETLQQVIDQRGALSASYACELVLQVLSALAAAHHRGIIHRDLKPANIMVVHPLPDTPVVKVLDFGIATGVQAGADESVEGVLGTPLYMAPEQALGQRVDERTDLYSAAVILYELLSGQSPFRARSIDEVIGEVVTGRWVPLGSRCPQLPESLTAVVDKMLSLDADSRYGSATEFARQLQGHRSNSPGAQRPMSLTSGDPFLLRAAESPDRQPPQRSSKVRKARKPAASDGSPRWLSQEALRHPVIPKAPLAPVIWEPADAVVTQPEGPPVPLQTERELDGAPARSAANEDARHPSTRPQAPSSDASGSGPSLEALEDGQTNAGGEAHAWLDAGIPTRDAHTLRLMVWAVVGMGIGAALAFL